MSLVADYSSDSDSDSDSDGINVICDGEIDNFKTTEETHLKLPDLNGVLNFEHSVFSTPFKQAEESRIAVLERHVKLVPSFDQLTTLNGKQICWLYKKGKCRFGNKCKYAHDHEIQNADKNVDTDVPENNDVSSHDGKQSTVVNKGGKRKNNRKELITELKNKPNKIPRN